MSEYLKKKNSKKDIVKNIIKELHNGLPATEAKEKLERKVGTITSSEIAEIEQSLINEGMPPEEIKEFCNVHTLLFESTLSKELSKEESKNHPVSLFKLENREIEKIINTIKKIAKKDIADKDFIDNLKNMLSTLRGIELHYIRKEQLLFPYLEKYGFMGPSKVMWGKDNEVRDLLKESTIYLETVKPGSDIKSYKNDLLNPLIEEVEGMIFKEENILFPTSLEKLKIDDWVKILKESSEVGYSYIKEPKDTSSMISEIKKSATEELKLSDDEIILPTGALRPEELMGLLNNLDSEITFIDKDDAVRYFSDNKERIFVRTKSIIGRKVQNCHPPQSVEIVDKILSEFKENKRDSAEFWLNFKGRLIHIKFLPIRDKSLNYLGTVELTTDITEIKKLKGEKRLLDEKD